MEDCDLCRLDLGPLVAASRYWRLIFNRNQNLLGKCFWALHRHLERVSELTVDEWADLRPQLMATTHALEQLWRPDHFNYAFLQNQDRHVHFHIIPRYASERIVGVQSFTDPDYPGHYVVPGPQRRLPAADLELLATALEQQLRSSTFISPV